MKSPLFLKFKVLLGLALLLALPLYLISNLVQERTEYRAQAVRQIAAGSAGPQSLVGPVLVLPFEEEFDQELPTDKASGAPSRYVRAKRTSYASVLPKRLHVEGNVGVERRAYGIHQASVFLLEGVVSGSFDPPSEAELQPAGKNAVRSWGRPRLVVGIADPRGLVSEPKIQMAGKPLAVMRGVAPTEMQSGFHADLGALRFEDKPLDFRIELNLAGTEAMTVIPLADMSTMELRGNWSHPSFGGGFLPRERTVNQTGFRALWSASALAVGEQRNVLRASATAMAHTDNLGFGVRFIDPVDIYRQASRAVKYGMLFVTVVFAAFFIIETVRRLPIHPMQYGLVGLALALFFLLLVSISEHLGFGYAYWLAASASVGLIFAYLATVLEGWRPAMMVVACLSALYGALYGILLSEQNALLFGSLLLFLVLAMVMLGTRGVDWYQLGADRQSAPIAPEHG